MTPRRRTAGFTVLPLLVVLAACSSGGKADPTPSPTTAASTTVAASTAPPGPQSFIADVKYAGFGLSDTSSPKFLNIGNVACQGLADGVSYGQQVQAFVESNAKPTQHQAEVLVHSAVRNLCPEYQGMLPR